MVLLSNKTTEEHPQWPTSRHTAMVPLSNKVAKERSRGPMPIHSNGLTAQNICWRALTISQCPTSTHTAMVLLPKQSRWRALTRSFAHTHNYGLTAQNICWRALTMSNVHTHSYGLIAQQSRWRGLISSEQSSVTERVLCPQTAVVQLWMKPYYRPEKTAPQNLCLLASAIQYTVYGIWPYDIRRVGQNHTFIGIYGVYTVFLAGKSPYIRSYTVCINGSGQP